jgi:Na+/melibiose symporter-like transporter
VASTAEKQFAREQKAIDPARLPMGKFFAWKSRDVSLAGAFIIVTGFLTLYCTDVLGLPAALVGTLLMASKIFDGITDLFAGYIIDNTNTKLGKARPYELCIFGVWICTLLLFSVPPSFSITVKAVWVFIAYMFDFSIFQTLLGTAQNPYTIRAFPNRLTLARVGSYGGIVTMLSGIAISVSFPILMGKLATSPTGWSKLVATYAIPLAVIGILRFIFVKEVLQDSDTGKSEKLRLKIIFAMLKTNKYAWFYAGIIGMFNFVIGMNVSTYYFKYIVGDISKMAILQGISVVILPLMIVFPKMIRKLSVAALITIGAVLAMAGYILNFIALDRIPLLIAGGVLTAFATLPISYLGALVIMDLASFNQTKGLPRMEACTSVLSGFTGKVAGGMGSAFVGIFMGAMGYDGTLAEQGTAALFAIRCMFSLIPLVAYAVLIIFAQRLNGLSGLLRANEQNNADKTAAAKG